MKQILLLILLAPVLSFAQTAPQFSIKGNVNGIPDGEVKISTTADDHVTVASSVAKAGIFTLTGSIPEPGLYFLVLPDQQPQYIFLENSPIAISGDQKDLKHLKIEGSPSHSDFVVFNTVFNPMIGNLNATAAAMQKEMNEKKRDQLLVSYDSIVSKVNDEVGNFIATRKSSYVSPFLLWVTAQLNQDPMLLEQRFKSLDPAIQSSQIGKSLSDYIAVSKIGAVGTEAMDFTQNDVNGKPVSLSSFKGKYVLLDFWASWCKPCRMENPNVVRVYNKYKDKNFTVLGVSLDQQKDAWVKAIDRDGLKWNHVSDLRQWDNAVAQLYHIQSIPGNYLIDPSGKIIARDLRGEDLEKKLQETIK